MTKHPGADPGLEAPASPLSARAESGRRRRAFRVFARNRTALAGTALVAVLILMAILAPWIAPYDPYAQNVQDSIAAPSMEHWLGTDQFGRDVLSRIIYGARVSLMVGVASVALGGIVGITLGVIAGFIGGRVEAFIMRVVDVLLAFPDLILALLVIAVIGGGMDKLIFVIALTLVPNFARLTHGPTLALREKEYVQSSISVGAGNTWIMWKHILPNVRGELIVVASLYMATAIRVEASLSFIGLGVAPPTATWGQMIRDGMTTLAEAPLFALMPGIAIFLAVAGFNLMGDGLRDVLDPRSAKR